MVIATPPGLSVPGWDEGDENVNNRTELEELLSAAQADLRAHLKQAESRAAELYELRKRAELLARRAAVRAVNDGTP